MTNHSAVVWVFGTHTEAETSIKELQSRGFDMKRLSIVGKDHHPREHVVEYSSTGDRQPVWGRFGAYSGGFWGLLFGAAMFVIPGVGPLMVFGPMVGWFVGAMDGTAVGGGLNALGAALHGAGIPKDSLGQYEMAIQGDKFLVVAQGTTAEMAAAGEVFAAAAGSEPATRGSAASYALEDPYVIGSVKRAV